MIDPIERIEKARKEILACEYEWDDNIALPVDVEEINCINEWLKLRAYSFFTTDKGIRKCSTHIRIMPSTGMGVVLYEGKAYIFIKNIIVMALGGFCIPDAPEELKERIATEVENFVTWLKTSNKRRVEALEKWADDITG